MQHNHNKVSKPISASVRALKYARKSDLRLLGTHYPRNCIREIARIVAMPDVLFPTDFLSPPIRPHASR